jgi:hypothetical protein
MQSQSSLAIDCHTNNSASTPSEIRLGLQAARGFYNKEFISKGKAPGHVNKKFEEAFNLGTIQVARAIKMENLVGSLAEGKLADLVIFDATSPAMICAAENDLVAAIVLHSSLADIEAVIVDGVWRKKGRQLLPIDVEKDSEHISHKTVLQWNNVARELIRSRKKIQEKIETLDFKDAKAKFIAGFQINIEDIVDKL